MMFSAMVNKKGDKDDDDDGNDRESSCGFTPTKTGTHFLGNNFYNISRGSYTTAETSKEGIKIIFILSHSPLI